MRTLFQKTRGSFLVDIMVSMGILTMSISASLTLINQSIQTNSVNKNKVIAVNLAREGIEGVRLIRDTNWLRYGTKKRICWNFWNNTNQDNKWEKASDSLCEEGIGIESGYNTHPIGISLLGNNINIGIKSYILHFDEVNFNWLLVENFTTIPDEWNGEPATQIDTCSDANLTTLTTTHIGQDNCQISNAASGNWAYRYNIVNADTLNSRLYLNDRGIYTHTQLGNEARETDFYREVFIEYPLGEGGFHPALEDGQNTSTIKATDNQILVTVNVWYKGHGGIMKKVSLETELTDYLERTNWAD